MAKTHDLAAQGVEELISQEGVRCILGTYSSACAVRIKPICRANKVLHIAAISNSENITKDDFSPYTFSVVPNSYMQARAVVIALGIMSRRYKWTKYATLASDYEWGRTTQVNVVKQLKEVAPQVKLVKEFWPPLGEKNFVPCIEEIMKLKPNFVYGCLPGEDNRNWVQQAKQREFFKQISYPGSLISVSELITQAKTLPRGIVGLCRAPFFEHVDNPRMAQFVKAFRKQYNRYPSDWAVMEYDAVYALKQGIDKAQTIDNDAVKDVMNGMRVDTTRGRLSFRKIDNQLSCSSYVGKVTGNQKYPFPIYRSVIEVKGPDSWRPESEIIAARKKQTKE